MGKKTDDQQMENEIVLKCPSEVNCKSICVCALVLGMAGTLGELSPAARGEQCPIPA